MASIIILTTLLALSGFMLVRNSYTCDVRIHCIYVISSYLQDNLSNYDSKIYEKALISYNSYMFQIWKWGKYSAIKPEYRDVLKKYMI